MPKTARNNLVHLGGLVDVVSRGEHDAPLAGVGVDVGDLDTAGEDVRLPLPGDLRELLHDRKHLPARELNLRELPDLVDDCALLRVLVVLDRHHDIDDLALRDRLFEGAAIGERDLALAPCQVERLNHLAEVLEPLGGEVAVPGCVGVGEGLAEEVEPREEIGAGKVENRVQLLGSVQDRRAGEERDVLNALGGEVLVDLALVAHAFDCLPLLPSTVRARHLDGWPLLLAAFVELLAQQARDLAMARTAVGVGADELLDVLVESCLGVADEVSLVDDEGVGAPSEEVSHEVRRAVAHGLVVEHGHGLVAAQ